MCFLLACTRRNEFGDLTKVSEVAVTYQAGCVCPLRGIWATRIQETKQAEEWEMRGCML